METDLPHNAPERNTMPRFLFQYIVFVVASISFVGCDKPKDEIPTDLKMAPKTPPIGAKGLGAKGADKTGDAGKGAAVPAQQ